MAFSPVFSRYSESRPVGNPVVYRSRACVRGETGFASPLGPATSPRGVTFDLWSRRPVRVDHPEPSCTAAYRAGVAGLGHGWASVGWSIIPTGRLSHGSVVGFSIASIQVCSKCAIRTFQARLERNTGHRATGPTRRVICSTCVDQKSNQFAPCCRAARHDCSMWANSGSWASIAFQFILHLLSHPQPG